MLVILFIQFLITLTFVSNQFLSISHIHSLGHIFIYISFGLNKFFSIVARDYSLFLGSRVEKFGQQVFCAVVGDFT